MIKVCEKCSQQYETNRSKRRFCSYFCAMKGDWNTVEKLGDNNVSKRSDVKKKMMGKRPQSQKEKSGMWKGDSASYFAIHIWIVKHWGKATKCDFCGKGKGWIDWANKSGEYSREKRSDWFQLCRPCHRAYDKGLKKRKKRFGF